MKQPDSTLYRRVDDIIECYPVSDSVRDALLKAMPNAYGGTPPGEDDWPEPDNDRDKPYLLSVAWPKLSPEIQVAIIEAARKEDR